MLLSDALKVCFSSKGHFNKVWEDMKSKYTIVGMISVWHYQTATKSQKSPLFTNDRIASGSKQLENPLF